MPRWIVPALVLAVAAGCPACNEDPAAPRPAAAKPDARKSQASAWKEVETPVTVGRKVSCEAALPVADLSASLKKTIALHDDSARDSEATAVCQLLGVDKRGKPTGEECLASIYCWSVFGVAEMKKRCDAQGGESSTSDLGHFTCVQAVQAGEQQRHVVTALDADTRCKVVVNAAPKQYELAQTKACARAVLDALDPFGLKQ